MTKPTEMTPEQIQQQKILRLNAPVMHFEPIKELDPMDKFGLKGLNNIFNDSNVLGVDLNLQGFEINTTNEKLSTKLSSPWLETARSEVEPIFQTPKSFRINNNELPIIEERFQQFDDLTLLFIFYTKPRDLSQELSARELNKRNWRYHKELQVWLTKDSNIDPTPINANAEEGTYIFFDPVSWEFVSKSLILYYNSII